MSAAKSAILVKTLASTALIAKWSLTFMLRMPILPRLCTVTKQRVNLVLEIRVLCSATPPTSGTLRRSTLTHITWQTSLVKKWLLRERMVPSLGFALTAKLKLLSSTATNREDSCLSECTIFLSLPSTIHLWLMRSLPKLSQSKLSRLSSLQTCFRILRLWSTLQASLMWEVQLLTQV